ncbi:MAG: glycosyltransferase family 4 protein [Myxococcales bacterium]|nr:glycosyltransferase family 4 protein [Myxococcales bacterium]
MRVLFLTHYFHPEGNAPGTRVYELCRRWVAMGHDVTVITGVPNVPNGVAYEGYRNSWLQRECVDGIETIRVWTYLAANKGATRRILNYLSLMFSATVAALFVRKPDLVIATSPQFFCGWAGVWVSRLRRIPFILEVRDLWPESIVAVGAMRAGRSSRFLEWLERRMYAAATRIVTVGAGYRDQLIDRGVATERIDIVSNGVDRELFSDRGGGSALRGKFDLGDAFVCSYIGTIGMGSGLEVVLRAARLLRDEGREDIVFMLVGDGAVREALERTARQEGLKRVVFTGRQDKRAVPDFLTMADACLVHLLRRDLFRTVLPSKIFEATAMKKPIILGVEGSAAQIVREANAGICIEPENEGELVEAVKRLAGDRNLADRMGQAGFESIAAAYDYDRLAEKYAEIIERVAAAGNSRVRG